MFCKKYYKVTCLLHVFNKNQLYVYVRCFDNFCGPQAMLLFSSSSIVTSVTSLISNTSVTNLVTKAVSLQIKTISTVIDNHFKATKYLSIGSLSISNSLIFGCMCLTTKGVVHRSSSAPGVFWGRFSSSNLS